MAREDVRNHLGHSTIVLTSNTSAHVLEQRQRRVARVMDAVLGRAMADRGQRARLADVAGVG